MQQRIYPAVWYKVTEASFITGLSTRKVRHKVELLPRDSILCREEHGHLYLRGTVVHALRHGKDPSMATRPEDPPSEIWISIPKKYLNECGIEVLGNHVLTGQSMTGPINVRTRISV